jgi:putative Mg2+ transporter-C (MgtC) family protein
MALELQLELCVRITVAALLSLLVGLEREWQGQPAGLRTHMLVGLGAALFTVLSLLPLRRVIRAGSLPRSSPASVS